MTIDIASYTVTDLFGHEVKNSTSWLFFVSCDEFIKLVFVCFFVCCVYLKDKSVSRLCETGAT